jgi:ankyrin repeat protein
MDLTKNQQGEFGTFWLENDRKGITPLHCASLAGHQEICETLFRRNVDLNKKTDNGKTPLLFAALRNHDALVSLFIEKDAEYSRAELCSTLLDTIKNRCEIQKDQKNSAQIINKVDSQGKTLLHKEAEKGNFEKCASLLNHFAKLAVVDSQQRTPLHLACQAAVDKRDFLVNHYLMTVLVLLNDLQGSDLGFINAQDKNGETALHYACKGGSSLVHIVQLLLSKGAYPQLVSQGLFGKTARTIANDSGSTALIALFEINE